ncbi:MAG TPA: element excision factor XisH family protein [Saprospiraceae bacterium]|nr:element excision factor XisH family protein [Saprospiraceae bacterium]HMQ84443.1 element excision factor XisH family protein [Saprospiraceae bacterium]
MARDKYHEIVRIALEAEGWIITNDPFEVSTLIADLEIDLAAERLIAAEKGKELIAVEVKSFLGKSLLHDFYKAVGQFSFYNLILFEDDPDRTLYLALPEAAFRYLFKDPIIAKLARINGMKFILFDIETKKITLWKK